ncbi:AAA domain-containing protein [Planctomycetes bacterium K23_9]|uniref:Uncharacterized protein n=1 Tax=Stieleria marina TaxID=1930275 RepID=A0A517P2E2_9BACT|nr:hypothetical protein K239x_55690 [Planctomycetes bacterium K23_9]
MNRPTKESPTKTIDQLIDTALADSGLPTDDVVSALLPLIRQAIDAHAHGKVAPLQGIERLKVDSGHLFFNQSDLQPIRIEIAKVQNAWRSDASSLEVIDEIRSVPGNLQVNGDVAPADAAVLSPVFVNGYQSWEQLLGHHDPITDVFCLGQILASLACGLDFCNLDDVKKFASARKNLFTIAPKLHPVVAQIIFQTTQLHRDQRIHDLGQVASTLENYRDASVGIEFDPELSTTGLPGAESNDSTKSELILRGLRKRLFDTTRRNRLLHFSPTMATINLTQASIPLSLDPENIDRKKLLLADDALLKKLGDGKTVLLNRTIDFQEVLYAPNVLDRIITDDRRDRAEYGFGGLRMAMAFLNWSNIKVQPAEHYHSPLVLVSVSLKKKKGVRDKYYLEAVEDEAEVNPVLRHQMQQLYAIELPEKIPLQAGAIQDLAAQLKQKISQSDASIQLDVVDRPQIALIHDKAQKRLQLYKKRARVSGRGVRHFGDLQYSYDPANYHPLGIRIFERLVRHPETQLEAITRRHAAPRRQNMVPDETEPTAAKTLYRWKEGGTGNPYHWQVDLCNITLASFKYRRMSLVRDYDAMIADPIDNGPFEALFSASSIEPNRNQPEQLSVTDRVDVVACDPTQAYTIAEARQGTNYIVQGPPGTGKSQTITNLIADFVAREKRVLFVCEKRAAIDVVYARLKAVGLGPAACLIHDAQGDKKEFIVDLKLTYESFLARDSRAGMEQRTSLTQKIRTELACLENVNELMRQRLDSAGMSLEDLLDQCLKLRDDLPQLSALQAEQLPDYADWLANQSHIDAVKEKLALLHPQASLASQPLALLRPSLASQPQPLAAIQSHVSAAKRSLNAIQKRFAAAGLPDEAWQTIQHVQQAVEYTDAAAPLAAAGLMQTIELGNKITPKLNKRVRRLQQLRDHAEQAAAKNTHWKEKLSPEDTDAALEVVTHLEGRVSRFLKPTWWRLRSVLKRSYQLSAHAVRPKWLTLLKQLQVEHAKNAIANQETRVLIEKYPIAEDPLLWPGRINRVMRSFTNNEQLRSTVHRPVMRSSNPGETMRRIAETGPMADSLAKSLEALTDCADESTLREWMAKLDDIEADLTQLPRFLTIMESLAAMPPQLSWSMRRLPLSKNELESSIADRTYRRELSRHPAAESYNGGMRSAHAARLSELYEQWQSANSQHVLDSVASRFLEHVALADDSTPTTREDRNQRRSYKKGRRELEHEFGKQMRFKPIRTLLSNDCRRVITDLKPIWLMSPLSVSDTLPLADDFDVVIFDEASQVTLQDAIPSLCRGKQVVVVGDQMQLPPTNFFAAKKTSNEEDEFTYRDDDGDDMSYDLSSASFLEFANRNLASTMLGWHYRSRSESLISFSNWRFYEGRLLTVPEENLAIDREDGSPIEDITGADDASKMLRDRPISFHFLNHGCYNDRRNRAEADHIARLVRNLLCMEDTDYQSQRLPAKPTIGVIAFSQAQQSEIESALARLADEDADFARRLDEESVREEDGQFVGLLVKNLENIQGDERDVVLLSVCYGPDTTGRTRMNFGPINKSGGEKRLNVAFSRAKHHMAIITSMRHSTITNDYNTGAAALRDYLRYAEAHCNGQHQDATALLKSLAHPRHGQSNSQTPPSSLKQQIVAALESKGWQVDQDVGQSHFRIDLAIMKPGDSQYRLGILLDDASYRTENVFERDVQRPKLLSAFGWRITHLLAKDWYHDSNQELQRIVKLGAGP